MPRLLALEWDAREARIAVARVRGREAVVEHALAVDLGPRDPGQTFADRNVGEQIAAAIASLGLGRCETLVAVGRASIELRRLSLPPSPPEELPEIVRFQALRQFTGIGEDWPLDFVPLDTGDPESLSVLAAAISPELVEQIRSTCQAGHLTPRRLVLRPFAAASLLKRRDRGEPQPCRLMVDLLADEADLTILVDQQVALVRTVRLSVSEDAGTPSRALLGEIRRTIAAAHNQLRDRRVEKVILCGDGSEQSALGSLIEQELGQSVEYLDPFAELTLDSELRQHKPEQPGRYAPLLGMILDEASGTGQPIDFLHPRKKPEPPSQGRRSLMIAAVAALALFALVYVVWSKLAALDAQIAQLARESSELKKPVQQAEQKCGQAASVDAFLESDVPWLDELYNLSRELPSSEDVIVTQLDMSIRSPKGGQLVVQGYTRESSLVEQVGTALRSRGRDVVSTGAQYDPSKEKYRWKIKETVMIEPQPVESFLGPAPSPGKEAQAKDEKTAALDTKDSKSR